MKFRQIAEVIRKTCALTVVSDKIDSEILEVKLFDPHSIQFSDTTLYFGYGSQNIAMLPPHCILAAPGKPASGYPDAGCLALIDPTDFGQAFNLTQDLIRSHQLDDFQRYIMDAAARVQNLDALIDIASQSFGASLIFCDRDFRIRSYSTQVPVTDHLWLHNIEQGYCDYEFIKEVRALKAVQMTQNVADPFEVTCTASPFQKFSCRVYCRDVWVGFILLIENEHSYRPAHIEMLRILNSVVGYSIMNYAPELLYRTNAYHSFLYNLLIGAPAETQPEMYLRLPFPEHLQIACCRPHRPAGQNSYPKESQLVERCRRLFPNCHMVIQRDVISVIGSSRSLQKYGRLIQLFPDDSDVRFGISRPFRSITSVRAAQQEAVDALETGMLLEPGATIYPFDQYRTFILLRHAAAAEDLSAYLHPALRQLLPEETAPNTDAGENLSETLRVYLECGGCIKDAAARLHLHRNSVTYRLGKIETICGIDLNDVHTRFELRLSFAALRIINRNV